MNRLFSKTIPFSVIFVVLLLYSCNNISTKKENDKFDTISEFPNIDLNSYKNTNYYPNMEDSFQYVGQTNYMENIRKIDVFYADTIKVYRPTLDSFIYQINELNYRHYTESTLSMFYTLTNLKDDWLISDSNSYYYANLSGDLHNNIIIRFRGKDSIYFQDIFKSSEGNRVERLFFKGKRLK